MKARALPTSLLLLTTLFVGLGGCSKHDTASGPQATPPYEGQYANASGKVVLEIKDGRVIFTNPTTKVKTDTSFSPTDDGMLVESGAGTFTLKFNPPDTLTGAPASITGSSGDLKKVTSTAKAE